MLHKLGGHGQLVLAADVAKSEMVAVLWDPEAERTERAVVTVSWKHPLELPVLLKLLVGLQRGVSPAARLRIAKTRANSRLSRLQLTSPPRHALRNENSPILSMAGPRAGALPSALGCAGGVLAAETLAR